MEQRLSSRVRQIAPSATISVDTKTKALIREGKPVINMSVGEPDFDTPVAAAYAGIRAITSGQTRYTPAAGLLELRKAIAHKLMVENGLSYQPEQIIVSSGAKHSLFNIFLAICEPGDEVILPAPYWVSYPEQIRLSGANPVIVPCGEESGYKITADQLRAAITPKTKAFLLNSPNNPTGAVYSEAELRALGEVLLDADIFLVTDEIYERLVYGVEHVSLLALYPQLADRTLVVNGFSKAFAMTGWRLGYVAAPADVAKALASLQSHATGNPSSVSQVAGIAALSAFDPGMVEEFHRRRDRLVAGLRELPGITCQVPQGAFYAFPNIASLFGKAYKGQVITDANAFCELLLEHELVSAVPGGAFGAPENIRLSYAVAYEQVETALERIGRFVRELA
ncbi:pyridoxal phosphate-dependent aminotransferase [Alicyclobacillus shizuokensis]|uniref:pyridoxal phosphate-dependent aminotransferase n=1 Tax=Alicyclobacillus shizuokensis TaxID=392014 RepID=UPI00083548EC|nr:pyridoxal phosphate-dependent aminotransferase [Alicyclobacillus shizuokensis]MCL6625540.1 pyridoxal phosphate-dependent aminotransferase [Alicyclobacillus shizuokensis]